MSGPQAFVCHQLGPTVTDGDVVFVVQAGYHFDDALAVRSVLERRGIRATFVTPLPPADPLRRFRATTRRHREIRQRAECAGLPIGPAVAAEELARRAALLVVRNDWGPSRTLVELARQCRVTTIGWVEGAQDFHDVDTGRSRNVYGTVDLVFALGPYDAEALKSRAVVEVIGSDRLWHCWRGPTTSAVVPLVANANFTYGVYEAVRHTWLAEVRDAARDARLPLTVSYHPASRPSIAQGWRRGETADELLPTTARLVTRFSTLIYEALVRGVEVAYYNPHGERVPNFADPIGAFGWTSSQAELLSILQAPPASPEAVRDRAEPFLRRHLRLDEPAPSELAADRIEALLPR